MLENASVPTERVVPVELPRPVLPQPPPADPEPDMYWDGEQMRELYKARKKAQRRAMMEDEEAQKKGCLPFGCTLYLIFSFICGIIGVIVAIDEGRTSFGEIGKSFFVGFCGPTFLFCSAEESPVDIRPPNFLCFFDVPCG